MMMNEFTKEELEELVDLINDVHIGTQRHGLEMHFPLRDKIQSMIDNYCEHEKMEFDGDVYGYSCKHCERQFTGQIIDADRHYNIISGKE